MSANQYPRDMIGYGRNVPTADGPVWIAKHTPPDAWKPSRLTRSLFVEIFGGIYEHSRWVAEAAYDRGLGADADTAAGLVKAMAAAAASGTAEQKRALIAAHPDLAGRLAHAKQLTADSTEEQSSARLDQLTADELARFTSLNDAYKAKFGFPFILAVKGKTKDEVVAAFEQRLAHDASAEFATALQEIDRIAAMRIRDILPSA